MNLKKSSSWILIGAAFFLFGVLLFNSGFVNWGMVGINKFILGNQAAVPGGESAIPLNNSTTNYLDYQLEVAGGNLAAAETMIESTEKSDYFKQIQLTRIGLLYLNADNLRDAIRICRQIKTQPLLQKISESGNQAYLDQKWATVVQIYAFRIELDSADRSLYRRLINAYKGLNDIDSAINEAMRLIGFAEPVLIQDYQELAELNLKKGLPQQAEYWWTVALLRFPDSEVPLVRLMQISDNLQSNKEKTIGYADRLVADFPDRFQALYNAANIYYRVGLTEKSENYARQAITLSPNNASAHFVLGNALIKKNFYEAKTELETSINLDPNYFWSWIVLGDLMVSRDIKQAIQDYQSALNVKNITPEQKTYGLEKLKKYNLP